MAQKKSSNPIVSLTSGCIAGGIEATAVWPMEYMKTQLQLQARLPVGKVPKFTGVFSGIAFTVKTEGFLALYRGLFPTLLGSIPKAGIRFGGNSMLKEKLADKHGKLTAPKQFAAGFGAGLIEAVLVVVPVETVKTKAIEGGMNFGKCMKNILTKEGPAGLYQGLAATIAKQGSNQGLRFMWFNEFQRVVGNDGRKSLTMMENFVGGMTAGCFSTIINNPLDVVKTRMQGLEAKKYNGTLGCILQIMSNEGIPGFYKCVYIFN
eukprot:271447_1